MDRRRGDPKGMKGREPASALLVVAVAAAVLLLLRATGGASSYLAPLIYLPIILAVVSCSFEVTVAVGLVISLVYIYVLAPLSHGVVPPRDELVRGATLNLVALIGAFYARRVHQEREALHDTVQQKEALLNASQIINSADKLEHALNSMLLMLRTLVPGFRCAAVFLADDTQRFMELAAMIGAEPGDKQFERFSTSTEKSGWDYSGTEPGYIPDYQPPESADHPGHEPRPCDFDRKARSVVCCTLRSLSVPIGLLFVSSDQPDAFSEAQVRLIGEFADRIGFPLQKLRVQEGLRGLAFTDAMTGLYNFRSFRSHLEDEFKRSIRYRRPLSLIVIDLDSFKGINDRYGHPAGDKLLMGVAEIIRKTVRETDLPARYGGEEFVVICPETASPEAHVVGDRVRAAVEAARFQLQPGETCAVTLSAGVATYPVDAHDEAALIDAADRALYHAKRTGKNRVVSVDSLAPVAPEST